MDKLLKFPVATPRADSGGEEGSFTHQEGTAASPVETDLMSFLVHFSQRLSELF